MAMRAVTAKDVGDTQIARRNWGRYAYGRQRGHSEFCKRAARLEGMYLGGGEQWEEDDKDQLEDEGRKPYELNEIFDAINSALGHQIQNRVDISYRARSSGADEQRAEVLSKVAMQIADNNNLRHKETQVTGDGFIQQRGFYEIRVDYRENLFGEIVIDALDPMDVLPDPDAKDYDPDNWRDVIITRWLSLDDIENLYGRKARRRVEEVVQNEGEDDFGEGELDGIRRNRFGGEGDLGYEDNEAEWSEDDVMVRVVDRQHWKVTKSEVVLYPSGDIRVIENASPRQIEAAINAGAMTFSRPSKRVRWTVSTYGDVLLHDDWSEYNHFTVVPYFPFFRRGKTRGLVDNAVAAQEMLNKAASQYIHIINTMANSGWLVQENSLSNMSTDDLEEQGAATGLVIEYKHGTEKPEKIQPNNVPTGVDRLIQLGSEKIRTITGLTDAFRGQAQGQNQSGRAVQALQFGSQLSLAVPLDNLARTRHMLADRMLELIQSYMDVPQVLQIIDKDVDGNETTSELQINWEQVTGEVLNDLTIGEYDTVVTELPNAVTFEHSQYMQALEMKEKGAPIPWSYILRKSSLSDKNELVDYAKQQEGQTNPVEEAKAILAKAQATLATAQAGNVDMQKAKNAMEAFFSAMRSSQLLRSDPALAALADPMLLSGGFVDQNQAPIIPDASGLPPGAPPPMSTHPITPDNPTAGVNAGMETAPALGG